MQAGLGESPKTQAFDVPKGGMMARIRTVKPEFFRHIGLYKAEKESKLPLRVAFAGLWTAADREGRFRWVPEELKLDCLPHDTVDFSRVLDCLENHGFIIRYENAGRMYGYIPSWADHQRINAHEAKSMCPSPDDDESQCTTMHMHARGEGKGREGKGREGVCHEPVSTDSQLSPEFLSIPLVSKSGEKQNHIITEADVEGYQKDFPGIDVEQTLRDLRRWNDDNPSKRKTPTGIKTHIGRWLSKEQNRGGKNKQGENATEPYRRSF